MTEDHYMCAACGLVETTARARNWSWGTETRGMICEACRLEEDAEPSTNAFYWQNHIAKEN